MKKQFTHNIVLAGFLITLVILFFCMTTANANYYDDQEKLRQEGEKLQNYIDNQKREARSRAYDPNAPENNTGNPWCCIVPLIIMGAGIFGVVKQKSKK